MLKEFLAKFTGRQLTILASIAMLAPSAVTAAVVFTPVSIINPNTGKRAYVDNSARLAVYDPIAGYRNNPANLITILISNNGAACETAYKYTVPAGKALIITAASGFTKQWGPSSVNSGFDIYEDGTCGGNIKSLFRADTGSTGVDAPVAVDLGGGIVFKAGKIVTVYSYNNVGYTFLHGYLIPASAVPATPNEAGAEPKSIDAAEYAAKMKRLKMQ